MNGSASAVRNTAWHEPATGPCHLSLSPPCFPPPSPPSCPCLFLPQVALLNGIFIATGGNLAASFAAAAANQLLLSAMQRRGLARMKEVGAPWGFGGKGRGAQRTCRAACIRDMDGLSMRSARLDVAGGFVFLSLGTGDARSSVPHHGPAASPDPQRSAAMARELKAYNVELAKIANKYKDRLPKVGWWLDASHCEVLTARQWACSRFLASGCMGSFRDQCKSARRTQLRRTYGPEKVCLSAHDPFLQSKKGAHRLLH